MRRLVTVIAVAALALLVTTSGVALPDQQGQISYFDENGNFVGAILWGCASYDLAYYGDTSGDRTLTWTASCDNTAQYLTCDAGETPMYYGNNSAPQNCASPGYMDCYYQGHCQDGLHP